MEAIMVRISARHTHKFSIADNDTVRVLLNKIDAPNGSHSVDEEKLLRALDCAALQYNRSSHEASQAFFHGLLTGYAVGLKHK
jgi:hypothetical protein